MFLPNRKSTWLRRSPYFTPGWIMFTNSIGIPLESGRPRLVWNSGAMIAEAPRLWLVTLGKLLPGYGTLWNVLERSTSILGSVYDPNPLTLVWNPDSRGQNSRGHWPGTPVPPKNGENALREPPHPYCEM